MSDGGEVRISKPICPSAHPLERPFVEDAKTLTRCLLMIRVTILPLRLERGKKKSPVNTWLVLSVSSGNCNKRKHVR